MAFRYSPARRAIKALLEFLLSSTAIALMVGWSSPINYAETLRLKLVSQTTLAQRLREGAIRNKDRKEATMRLFQSVGCDAKTQPATRRSANVICDLPGEMSDTIVVGGHLDFIDAGQGIVDDWSAASMLVSLYETLKWQAPKHSFKFVTFAGEERGLLGSRRYVENLKKSADSLPEAFVNLECLGMAPPKVWASRADRVLLRNLIEVSDVMHISLQGVSVDNVGDDDSHPFLKKEDSGDYHPLAHSAKPTHPA